MEINITKKHFWVLTALIILSIGVFVYAVNTSSLGANSPEAFGHDVSEITALAPIISDVIKIGGEISSLKTKVQTLESNIASLESQVGEVQGIKSIKRAEFSMVGEGNDGDKKTCDGISAQGNDDLQLDIYLPIDKVSMAIGCLLYTGEKEQQKGVEFGTSAFTVNNNLEYMGIYQSSAKYSIRIYDWKTGLTTAGDQLTKQDIRENLNLRKQCSYSATSSGYDWRDDIKVSEGGLISFRRTDFPDQYYDVRLKCWVIGYEEYPANTAPYLKAGQDADNFKKALASDDGDW